MVKIEFHLYIVFVLSSRLHISSIHRNLTYSWRQHRFSGESLVKMIFLYQWVTWDSFNIIWQNASNWALCKAYLNSVILWSLRPWEVITYKDEASKNVARIFFKRLIFLKYENIINHSLNALSSRWFSGWWMYFYFSSDCKENKGIYTSLHLEHLFNINEFLNISMVSKESLSGFVNIFEGWYILRGGTSCPN